MTVIGKQGINIPKERAMDHVYGYTIMNEVSARDVQRRRAEVKAVRQVIPIWRRGDRDQAEVC